MEHKASPNCPPRKSYTKVRSFGDHIDEAEKHNIPKTIKTTLNDDGGGGVVHMDIVEKFAHLEKNDQVTFVQNLLIQMDHNQLGDIDSFLKPMLQKDFITALPFKGLTHVAERILEYLDPESLKAAEHVSPTWAAVIREGMLWKKLIEYSVQANSTWRGLGERVGWIRYLRVPGRHIHPRRPCDQHTPIITYNSGIASQSNIGGAGDDNSTAPTTTVTAVAAAGAPQSSDIVSQPPSSCPSTSAEASNTPLYMQTYNMSGHEECAACRYQNGKYWLLSHAFYRFLYPRILQHIKEIESNWQHSKYSHRKIDCNSEASKGVYCLQYDDTKIVSGLRDNTVKVWDVRTLSCTQVLSGHVGSVLCLQYDGSVIISGSSDASVRVWSLATWQCVHTIHHHCEAVLHLRFSEGTLVTCSKDRSIAVWEMHAPNDIRLRRVLVGHRAAVNVVDFDQKYIVSASGDRSIKVWNTSNCDFVRTMIGHRRGIACLQYRGDLVVSGSSDNHIRLWDIESGMCIRTLVGHEELVRCIRFDSKYIVSGAYDGKIKVWDLRQARNPKAPEANLCLGTLEKHTGRVFRLQFDDFQIVSSSHDDTILVWDFLNATDMPYDSHKDNPLNKSSLEAKSSTCCATSSTSNASASRSHAITSANVAMTTSCIEVVSDANFPFASRDAAAVTTAAAAAAASSSSLTSSSSAGGGGGAEVAAPVMSHSMMPDFFQQPHSQSRHAHTHAHANQQLESSNSSAARGGDVFMQKSTNVAQLPLSSTQHHHNPGAPPPHPQSPPSSLFPMQQQQQQQGGGGADAGVSADITDNLTGMFAPAATPHPSGMFLLGAATQPHSMIAHLDACVHPPSTQQQQQEHTHSHAHTHADSSSSTPPPGSDQPKESQML